MIIDKVIENNNERVQEREDTPSILHTKNVYHRNPSSLVIASRVGVHSDFDLAILNQGYQVHSRPITPGDDVVVSSEYLVSTFLANFWVELIGDGRVFITTILSVSCWRHFEEGRRAAGGITKEGLVSQAECNCCGESCCGILSSTFCSSPCRSTLS